MAVPITISLLNNDDKLWVVDADAGGVRLVDATDAAALLSVLRIYPYDGTGSEGDSWTIAGLSGKTVSGVFRAGIFKRVITTVPVDTESVRVSGTTVALQTGDALVPGERLDFLYY